MGRFSGDLLRLSVPRQVSGNEFIALYERASKTSFVGYRRDSLHKVGSR
jgi:hypothetical protein